MNKNVLSLVTLLAAADRGSEEEQGDDPARAAGDGARGGGATGDS